MRKLLVVVILLTAACAAPATEMVACPPTGCAKLAAPTEIQRMLLEPAAFDLQCPSMELEVKDLDSVSSAVTGCGRTARYAWLSGRWTGSRWLLDSPVISVTSR